MTLQQLIEDMNYETRSYSGRGMFGKTCLGVTVDNVAQFCLELGHAIGQHNEQNDDDLIELPRQISTDSMGRSAIVYFPYVAFVDEDFDVYA